MIEVLCVNSVIEKLNEMLASDPKAVSEIFLKKRVKCNEKLAHHPTVQVGKTDSGYSLGILGLLNGLFGVYDSGSKKGWGPIAINVDRGRIISFEETHNPWS